MAKELLKGNVAVAEAALRGGFDFFAGYPITPSTETLEYLSHRMPELGMETRFVQSENEIAAINMVMGAASAGARAFTASSGPGISLKAEGMSYAAHYAIPFVMLNVQRWGTGLGSLKSGQADYYRDCKGGGHGDYHNVVFAPNNIQEMVDDIYEAWEIAERYRVGVTIFSEAVLGQMMESVEMPPFKKREIEMDWGIDGTGTKGMKYPGGDGQEYIDFELSKYERIIPEMQRWEQYRTEDAEYVFTAFGLPSRVCVDVVDKLRESGEKVGLFRPKILWPFPHKGFEELHNMNPNVRGFISVEMNDMGQMVDDVALAAKRAGYNVPTYCYPCGGGVPRVKMVLAKYHEIKNGELKEMY